MAGTPQIGFDPTQGGPDLPQPAQPVVDNTTAGQSVDPLLRALIARGKRTRRSITLTPEELSDLCERVRRDFNDGAAACQPWYQNQVELVKNWEGIVDPKSFPYENAANIRVPFTSVQIQQWVSRLVKALLGGDFITTFERLDEQLDSDALDEMNQWFQWELTETVGIHEIMEQVISQTAIGGICLPIPKWHKERRVQYERQEFEFDPARDINDTLQAALGLCFNDMPFTVTGTSGAGVFKVEFKDPDEPEPDKAKVTFSVVNSRLVAEVEKPVTMFNGVKIDVPNKEDIVVINTNPKLEKLPFNGLRIWLSTTDYADGMRNGEWYDLGEEDNNRILATATSKVPEIVPMDYTTLQDEEEGTTSTDPAAYNYERRFIEVYRWEGWIHRNPEPGDEFQNILSPAIGVCAWVVPRAKLCIRVERLEALNKDGERSMVKFGFIPRDNRFFDIGLAEWLRHVQAELDGIHNLRLDSATLIVMPFGFYKPLAGLQKDIFDIQPGKMFPTADPSSVNFPRTNANPQWSYQDEALVKKYGGEQSGLGETATGGFVSKRQSASEYLGQANAIDLRTELVVNGFLRSLRKLLYRILGLYQQFAPPTRIFQIAGEDGLRMVKRFETDRLHGKMLLRLTGNVDQINPQLRRDVATNMLSLMMNQILIQLGIVKPDTIYAAVKQVAKVMNYKDVPFYKPDMPQQSPPPDVENRMMYNGEEVHPNMGEPFDHHLKSHTQYLTDPKAPKTQKSVMLVMQHIQETQKLMQVEQTLRLIEGAQANQAQQSMASMGINPGQQGGQQPGDNVGAGTRDEGAQGAQEAA